MVRSSALRFSVVTQATFPIPLSEVAGIFSSLRLRQPLNKLGMTAAPVAMAAAAFVADARNCLLFVYIEIST